MLYVAVVRLLVDTLSKSEACDGVSAVFHAEGYEERRIGKMQGAPTHAEMCVSNATRV